MKNREYKIIHGIQIYAILLNAILIAAIWAIILLFWLLKVGLIITFYYQDVVIPKD